MPSDLSATCELLTKRLSVGPWHGFADQVGIDLATVVTGILNERTTAGLPESWRGSYSLERAKTWIADRDAESPTLLVVERDAKRPIGLVMLVEIGRGVGGLELRVGYVIAENAAGQGFASELLAGLVSWARTQPSIRAISGGVEQTNHASVRVLEKSGFRPVGEGGGALTYQLDLG